MNPFERLVNDIFKAKDFVEYVEKIESGATQIINVPCITSSIVNEAEYTAFGLDEGINFYLMFKLAVY